ncbi:MAG TPA: hypothetical protein VN611_17135 [Patescibacteria group bacterium]|nr:hypothetical protein [Patescibacteria group bacterium]
MKRKRTPLLLALLTLLLVCSVPVWAADVQSLDEAGKKYLAGKTLCQVPETAVVHDVWLERQPFSMQAHGVIASDGEYVRIFWLDAADGSYEWRQHHEKLQLLTLVKEDRLVVPADAKTAAGEIANVALFKVGRQDTLNDFLSFTLYAVQGKMRDNVQMVEVKVSGGYSSEMRGLLRAPL